MAITLRPLERKDALKALTLFKKLRDEQAEVSFTEYYTEEAIQSWFDAQGTYVYVAAEDDVILAVVRAMLGEEGKQHAVVLTVAVDYNFRGQSLAKKLTLYCLDQVKKEGVKIARAYIYSNNYSSVATILSCGFVMAGCIHQHHYDERLERYVDDLIFHKVLE